MKLEVYNSWARTGHVEVVMELGVIYRNPLPQSLLKIKNLY